MLVEVHDAWLVRVPGETPKLYSSLEAITKALEAIAASYKAREIKLEKIEVIDFRAPKS